MSRFKSNDMPLLMDHFAMFGSWTSYFWGLMLLMRGFFLKSTYRYQNSPYQFNIDIIFVSINNTKFISMLDMENFGVYMYISNA